MIALRTRPMWNFMTGFALVCSTQTDVLRGGRFPYSPPRAKTSANVRGTSTSGSAR